MRALEETSGGDWRKRAARRRQADRLVSEAAYFERMVAKLDGPDYLEECMPF